jgi:hypothetical protein
MLYGAVNNNESRSGAYADKARQSRWFVCSNARLSNGRFPQNDPTSIIARRRMSGTAR